MIIGIGTDIVALSRIEKIIRHYPEKFIQRIFHESEIQEARQRFQLQHISCDHKPLIAYYAKRFAAKEAFVKALGTGFRKNIFFKDMAVFSDTNGKPSMHVFNHVLSLLYTKMIPNSKVVIHLSLSDEKDHATAFVIIENLA